MIFKLGEKDRQGIKELIQNGDVKKLGDPQQVKGVRQVYTDGVQTMLARWSQGLLVSLTPRNTNDWFLANIGACGSYGWRVHVGTQLFDLGVAKDEIP